MKNDFLCSSGKSTKTGKMYAFKQERPANLWEFYISLEIATRVEDVKIVWAIEHFRSILFATFRKNFILIFIAASRIHVGGTCHDWSQFQHFCERIL